MESSEKVVSQDEIDHLIAWMYHEIELNDTSFVEINNQYSQVLQIWTYRVVIVNQPLVKKTEITIVKSILQRTLDQYTIPENVLNHILHKARWIMITWAPWEGKSTFAQAFVQELAKKDLIIKTVESPRDLVLDEHISQYSFSHASHNEIRDILLLSRPDLTVYDEVRNKEDFILFKDLRLTWIWMIWVMHATKSIDWVQRMLGIIDMWVIPQVVDTIIYIKSWDIDQVLCLEQTVKTPVWMASEDLSRPVLLATDCETWDHLYEIYSYWDSTVVMPLENIKEQENKKTNAIEKYAKRWLEEYFSQEFWTQLLVKISWPQSIKIYVPERIKPRIIWKWWTRIQNYEKTLWVSISVRDITERSDWASDKQAFTVDELIKGKKSILQIQFWQENAQKEVSLLIWGTVMNFVTNHEGIVSIRRRKLIELIRSWELELISI